MTGDGAGLHAAQRPTRQPGGIFENGKVIRNTPPYSGTGPLQVSLPIRQKQPFAVGARTSALWGRADAIGKKRTLGALGARIAWRAAPAPECPELDLEPT